MRSRSADPSDLVSAAGPRSRLLMAVASALACLSAPALPKMYSCEDVAGRITLRDVPCKRDERDRNPSSATRVPVPIAARVSRVPSAGPITKARVEEVIEGMDAARARGDAEAMLNFVAVDAVFEVEYRLPEGMQFKRFNKEEYATHLRAGGEFVDGLDFQRDSTAITVASSAREAEIISNLRETVRIGGQAVTRVTRSRSLVEIRDGRPKIILVRAVVRYEVPERPTRVGNQETNGRGSGR